MKVLTHSKVLVTGGAGFIGSRAVRTLLEGGAQVTVLDSFTTGSRGNIPEGVEVIEGDIRDTEVVVRAVAGRDYVVHLAALVSVVQSMAEPLETHAVNVGGMLAVLEAARNAGAKRFVYASSAAIYGNLPELPKSEKSALSPESPYALSKVHNELDAAFYGRVRGLPTAGLRFFNVYGEGQRADSPYASVIPRWVEAVKTGKPATLFGNGTQTRDFIHVSDVARAITLALTADAPGDFVANIASGTGHSLQELWGMLQKARPDAVLERADARPGDIAKSVADVARAREVLGFSAEVPFESGVVALLA